MLVIIKFEFVHYLYNKYVIYFNQNLINCKYLVLKKYFLTKVFNF